ncbi:MAG TPA: rubredoxin [Thermodesulfobacteriota bacterium]|nr:rubredoxin [Thermodesulfobacteriota bacterium]
MLYICPVCSYRYDDDFEMDPFDKLPDDWCCPVCKAAKISFRAIWIDHNEGDG